MHSLANGRQHKADHSPFGVVQLQCVAAVGVGIGAIIDNDQPLAKAVCPAVTKACIIGVAAAIGAPPRQADGAVEGKVGEGQQFFTGDHTDGVTAGVGIGGIRRYGGGFGGTGAIGGGIACTCTLIRDERGPLWDRCPIA